MKDWWKEVRTGTYQRRDGLVVDVPEGRGVAILGDDMWACTNPLDAMVRVDSAQPLAPPDFQVGHVWVNPQGQERRVIAVRHGENPGERRITFEGIGEETMSADRVRSERWECRTVPWEPPPVQEDDQDSEDSGGIAP